MSSLEMYLKLELEGTEKASSKLRRFVDRGVGDAKRMANAWLDCRRRMSVTVDYLKRAAYWLGGASLVKNTINSINEYNKSLTELRFMAGMTAEQAAKLRNILLELGPETLQEPTALLNAFKEGIKEGIDPTTMMLQMRNLAEIATATMSDVQMVTATAAELYEQMSIKPDNWRRAFNIISLGAKEGELKVADLMNIMPEASAKFRQFGLAGEQGLAQMVALLEATGETAKTPQEALVKIEAFFNRLIMAQKELKKHGINLSSYLNPERTGFKDAEAFNKLLNDIYIKTGGAVANLPKVFGQARGPLIDFFGTLFVNWNKYEQIQRTALATTPADIIDAQFKDVKKETWAEFDEAKKRIDTALKSEPFQKFTKHVGDVTAYAVEHPVKTAIAAIGAYGGFKLIKFSAGRLLSSWLTGRAGRVAPIGGALGGLKTPVPVYVVNKYLPFSPELLGGKAGGAGAEVATAGAAAAKKGWWAKLSAQLSKPVLTLGKGVVATGATGAGILGSAALGSFYGVAALKGAIGVEKLVSRSYERLDKTLAKEEAFVLAKRERALIKMYEEKRAAGASKEVLDKLLAKIEETQLKRAENIQNMIQLNIQIDEAGRVVTAAQGVVEPPKVNVQRGSFR